MDSLAQAVQVAFKDRPAGVMVDRESRQQRVRAVLLTYCCPAARFDGMTAWEVAGKILATLDEEPEDSKVRR